MISFMFSFRLCVDVSHFLQAACSQTGSKASVKIATRSAICSALGDYRKPKYPRIKSTTTTTPMM